MASPSFWKRINLTLIIDTAPLVALGDARDPRHLLVRRVLEREQGSLVLPCAVAAEVDYLARRAGGRAPARRFLADMAAGRFQVECLSEGDLALALSVDDRYADFDLGLADLSVIVLAHRFGTQRVLTFDERHFRAVRSIAGEPFLLLPADDAE